MRVIHWIMRSADAVLVALTMATLVLLVRRVGWQRPRSVTSFWGVFQVATLGLLIYALLSHAYAAGFPFHDPCRQCEINHPNDLWICWLQLCF